ncbi:MAG: galactose oxidase-like domain-containing protein, partial [Actinomycetota bacterium]
WQKNRQFMTNHRWYPTMITQGDGDLFIASGVARLIYNYSGQNVNETETFDPQTGSVKLNRGESATSLPLFPRLHLMPDGKIFYDGVGQMWGPFGQAIDEALWAMHKAYDPKKKTWTTYGMGPYGARSGALSVLMPLQPPYKRARILIAGGTLGSSPGSYVANDLSEIVTVGKNGSSSAETEPMVNRRWYSSSVLLPNGHVLAFSGADRDEVVLPGSESPVRQAELFNGKRWLPLATAKRVRTYHNTAILLPDGRVLVGGHSPINNSYGPTGDNSTQPVTGTNNLKDPSFEIFEPPYLFHGPRPSIASVQEGLAWGHAFSIGSPDATDVEKVVLSRLPTTTHITDADQRSVELDFNASGNTITTSVPGNHNVLPPGYYYLWILTDNGEGLTPSKARIVTVGGSEVGGQAVAPMGR